MAKLRRSRSSARGSRTSPRFANSKPSSPTPPTPPADKSPSDKKEIVAKESSEDPDLCTDVVFQCGSCQAILGDTLSEYRGNLESKTISLKAARGLKLGDILEMSNSGFDAGCTFRRLECANCSSVLGRVYSSTTPVLDSCRETYTFDTDALLSYQLGSCKTMDGRRSHRGGPVSTTSHEPGEPSRSGGMVTRGGGVSAIAFDALDAHVGSLTEATNKLSAAVEQDRDAITELRSLADVNTHSTSGLQSGLEQAQNMMLVWEERFRRLEACEQKLEQLAADELRVEANEVRLPRRDSTARIAQSPPPGQQPVHRPPSRLKVSPALRRTIPSPARTPLRRAPASLSATPSAKRRR